MNISFLFSLIYFTLYFSFTLSELTGECKNLSDYLKNNNIDYNKLISTCEMKNEKIIKL